MEDFSIVAETLVTTVGGLTVGSGGSINVASGTLKVTGPANVSGPANISGTASISGAMSVGGALTGPTSLALAGPGATSVSVATANNTTIPVAAGLIRISATAATTSGSCTLAAGGTDGQLVTLINESANNILISGNILKAVETVSATRGAQFCWISADTKWAMIGG